MNARHSGPADRRAMKRPTREARMHETPMVRARMVLLACAMTILCVTPSLAVSTSGQDPPRRDEFGVIPEDAVDKDLTLPDPILDRNWPGPRPGDKVGPPQHIAPDEDEVDPFADEVAPTPAPKADPAGSGQAPSRPSRPPVAPDGKYDAGSPPPEADPYEPPLVEPEIDEPSEIDQDDNRPSPLDRDDDEYDQESGDPGEW